MRSQLVSLQGVSVMLLYNTSQVLLQQQPAQELPCSEETVSSSGFCWLGLLLTNSSVQALCAVKRYFCSPSQLQKSAFNR